MKFAHLKSGLPAMFFAISLGITAHAQEGLPGAPIQRSQQNTEAMAQGQAQAFVDWAIENPKRLQAALNEMGIKADLSQVMREIEAPAASIAGTYRLRHYGEYGSITNLEVTPGLMVTRTRISQKGKVLSKMSGKADLVAPNQIKIAFGPEQADADGAARKIGRFFKETYRGIHNGLGARDAVYKFDGSGRVKGRFLTVPERGFRTDLIKPMAGTYKLYCADLVVKATARPDAFNVTRKDHDGNELFGKARVKGSKMQVKFLDGSRGFYQFRVDNKRVFGRYSPNSSFNDDNDVQDSGWRDGVTPEPNWLQRQFTKVGKAVKQLLTKVKVITVALVGAAIVAINHGWDRTKALAKVGWDKTKHFAQASWDVTKRVAKKGWDVTANFVSKAYHVSKDFALDVIYFIRCNLAALVGAVETGAGHLKNWIAPEPREAQAQ